MKKILTLTMTLALLVVMTFSLAACGGDTSTSSEPTSTPNEVSLVDVTTDKGISLKLPSELTLQDNGAYANMETGDSATFGVTEVAGYPISDWTEENVLATYSSKYDDVVVTSFQNGAEINGNEAMISQLTLTTPQGNDVTITLVMVTDDTNNYIVTFTYGTDKTDGALAQNLQACIDSIKIQ